MKTRKFVTGSLVALVGLLLYSFVINRPPDSNVIESLKFKLASYYDWYPQQKAYLHLDKEKYTVGERVWFKAYVVNATTHFRDSLSTNLYVQLINPDGYIVQTKLLKLRNGISNGDFAFQDTVPEGKYRIIAYTNWMMNVGSDYAFSREIYVTNPLFKTYATRDEVKSVKHSHRKNSRLSEKFDVSFLPEGGNLLNGVENRIAFKAINDLGHAVSVEGRLTDKKGNTLLSFKSVHDGMGDFSFTPKSGMHYKAYVKTDQSKEKSFSLPEGIDKGIVLRAEYSGQDSIHIGIVTNMGPGNMPENTTYYLLGQTRGRATYSDEFDLSDPGRTLRIPKNLFPSGITQFTLFNANSRPVSERLVFINRFDQLNVNVTPSISLVPKRKRLSAAIKVTDSKGQPVHGNFSVSVANEDDTGQEGNILTNLLLTSDIKGFVENPGFYFNGWNAEKEKLLDYIMMTNGWRRFDWNLVLLNEKLPVQFPVEDGIEISGKITRDIIKFPLNDIKVTLTILNQFNDVFITRSGPKGMYSFTGLDYPDTVAVKIEAQKDNGKKSLILYVDQKEIKRVKDMPYVTQLQLKKPGPEGRYTEPVEEVDDDPFAEENNHIYRLHNEPGKQDVIIVDEKLQHFQNVAQIIQGRIPGVLVNGNSINIRGINSIYSSTDPLFLVDGVVVDKDFALSMSPYDVERIEVIKGPNAAIYGSRGGNGVIAIYTRRGKFMIKGVLDFKMLGYYTPRRFYSPRYEYRRDESLVDDRTTLYWRPYVITDKNGDAEVNFYSSDIQGRYVINVQGMDENGTTGTGTATIDVR